MDNPLAPGWDALRERLLPDGGFSGRPEGQYRPDATAWAALALAERGARSEIVGGARARLTADQLEDGRIPVQSEHPNAAWPTSAAILAWGSSPSHREHQSRAVAFLLNSSGEHWPAAADAPFKHDPSIRGWPWVMNTHSWVEPTSLAILALRAAGHGGHERVLEAVRMLLDRQLPGGGWNYGNTEVFGKRLLPFPDSTGVALAALSGYAERRRVARSREYLAAELSRVRTPLTVGWGLLGLAAWEEAPPQALDWVVETLTRQGARDGYDTAHLALLLLAGRAASEGRNPFPSRGSHEA